MTDSRLPDPDELPVELLLRLALRETADGDADKPMPSLAALHRRAVPEVFDTAARLLRDRDPGRRELGVQILRELGDEQSDGRRPFHAETVPLLRALIRTESDPTVLRWVVSALGNHRVRGSLPEVIALAGHADSRVRFHVAACLTMLIHPADIQPDAAAALIRLCHDEDADTRYYALYAATREIPGLDADTMARLCAGLMIDPDAQVREMAADHRRHISELRHFLNDTNLAGVPNSLHDADQHDHMIEPLLQLLFWDTSPTDISRFLSSKIKAHHGIPVDLTRAEPIAARLTAWWQSEPR